MTRISNDQENVKIETSKEENKMKRLENVKEEISNIEMQISIVDAQSETVRCLLQEANKQAETIREEIRRKQEELIVAESEVANYQGELEGHEKELAELYEAKASLEEEAKLLSITFILAPKFRGKFKEGRNYVSTVASIQGVEVKQEVIPEEQWLSKPSIEAMVASGYDSYAEFMEGFSFVQLVLSYKLQNKPHELICNNPKIQKLIDYEWERSGDHNQKKEAG